MAKVWSSLDDSLSLLCSSHDMFRFDVNPALEDYFRPLFYAMRKRLAAFHSESSSPAETLGETLRQSASSLILSLDQWRTSWAAVYHLRLAFCNTVGPDDLTSS